MNQSRPEDEEDTSALIRVAFSLPRDPESPNWPPSDAETMWAEMTSDDEARLKNIPFYARGVAYDDIVRVRPTDTSVMSVDGVARHNGHSTYRIALPAGMESGAFDAWWPKLADLGCWYEKANATFYAIDCPPGVDVHKVYKVLQDGEANGILDFEEGFYFDPTRV